MERVINLFQAEEEVPREDAGRTRDKGGATEEQARAWTIPGGGTTEAEETPRRWRRGPPATKEDRETTPHAPTYISIAARHHRHHLRPLREPRRRRRRCCSRHADLDRLRHRPSQQESHNSTLRRSQECGAARNCRRRHLAAALAMRRAGAKAGRADRATAAAADVVCAATAPDNRAADTSDARRGSNSASGSGPHRTNRRRRSRTLPEGAGWAPGAPAGRDRARAGQPQHAARQGLLDGSRRHTPPEPEAGH